MQYIFDVEGKHKHLGTCVTGVGFFLCVSFFVCLFVFGRSSTETGIDCPGLKQETGGGLAQ